MLMHFSHLVVIFAICGFLAWLSKNIAVSAFSRKARFNGFLFGPFAPLSGLIYLASIIFLHYTANHPVIFFLLCCLLIGFLRFVFYYVLCYVLQMKLLRENIRLMVFDTVISALMCMAVYYLLLPVMASVMVLVPEVVGQVLSSFVVAGFIGISIISLYVYSTLWQSVGFLSSFKEEIKKIPGSEGWFNENDLTGSALRSKEIHPEDEELASKFDRAIKRREVAAGILARFPRLIYYVNVPMTIVDEKLTIKDLYGDIRRFFRRLFYAGSFDDYESKTSFARGFNFYKLLWIFFIASMIGYLVETVFCFVTRGYVESRQGMLYGPFNQIYGFGAILLLLALYKIRHMRFVWIFLTSAVIGGLFEALSSYIQQTVFGTVSWDYSGRSFSFLGGRTNLTYMAFWGILGVVFMKEIYPRMSRFVEKIPNRLGINVSMILAAFFAFDILISCAAVYRQQERHKGTPADNAFSVFMDQHYPDSYLEKIYPNMIGRYNVK